MHISKSITQERAKNQAESIGEGQGQGRLQGDPVSAEHGRIRPADQSKRWKADEVSDRRIKQLSKLYTTNWK